VIEIRNQTIKDHSFLTGTKQNPTPQPISTYQRLNCQEVGSTMSQEKNARRSKPAYRGTQNIEGFIVSSNKILAKKARSVRGRRIIGVIHRRLGSRSILGGAGPVKAEI
jgi:hypothetical protein